MSRAFFTGALAFALVLAACGPSPTRAPARRSFATAIPDAATWRALATRPADATVARTEALKLVVDLEDDARVYFLDAHQFDLHFAFVSAMLDPAADHATFNVREYRRPERRYLLATLLDGDLWTLELVAGDTLDAERIVFLHERVRPLVFFGDALRFRPTSTEQETRVASLGARLPHVATDAVRADVAFQPLVTGEAYGIVRIRRGALEPALLGPNEIVVTDDVPEELAPVSALVTSRLQAPLAHVAVLSRNRRTPDMALRGAIDDARFLALEGKLARIRVTPQDFSIEPASLADAERSWASRRPRRAYVPTRDAETTELRESCRLRMRDAAFAGAKAAQLGELCALGADLATPGGFVVPLAHDLSHRARAGVDRALAAWLEDAQGRERPEARSRFLADLRARLEATPVDPALVSAVERRLAEAPDRKFIFRSSTNAEDLVGFNGAGLYESLVVPAHADRARVEATLRRVWASTWLERAFEEREWYRIDHRTVAMAILVQPFVDDVLGNGVAITANPFFEGRPGVFVNVQARGGSVTGARGDELPEQHLVYTWAEDYEAELLSRSTLTHGAPILEPADVLSLAHALTRIHAAFVPRYGRDANAVDVEFLVTRDHRFVFVQARAYRVEYGPGQRWPMSP